MVQKKLSEQEMAFILDRMDSFGAGASLRDKLWSIWVKGSGSKWAYNSMAGTYMVLSAEELVREFGFAGFRTAGLEEDPTAIPRTEGMTETEISELSEAAIRELDMAGTVVAHDGSVWVKGSNGEWFLETADGGYVFMNDSDLISEYGPLVTRSSGKVSVGIKNY